MTVLEDQTPPEINGHFSAMCEVVSPLSFSFPSGRKGAAGSGLKTCSAWHQGTCSVSFEEEPPAALKVPQGDPVSWKLIYLLSIPGNELETQLEGRERLSLKS